MHTVEEDILIEDDDVDGPVRRRQRAQLGVDAAEGKVDKADLYAGRRGAARVHRTGLQWRA